jgi:hypothetical protein
MTYMCLFASTTWPVCGVKRSDMSRTTGASVEASWDTVSAEEGAEVGRDVAENSMPSLRGLDLCLRRRRISATERDLDSEEAESVCWRSCSAWVDASRGGEVDVSIPGGEVSAGSSSGRLRMNFLLLTGRKRGSSVVESSNWLCLRPLADAAMQNVLTEYVEVDRVSKCSAGRISGFNF